MKKHASLLILLFIGLVLTSCGGEAPGKEAVKDPNEQIKKIEQQEEKLFAEMGQHSDSLAKEVMKSYSSFVQTNPDHDRTPEFLFRSANIARSYRMYDQAMANYERIVKDYPDYENITESHFLMAFMYDNDFKDKAKAETLYKEVAQKYKGHIFAKQAEERLKTLHLTDEELIERFKKMNSEEAK